MLLSEYRKLDIKVSNEITLENNVTKPYKGKPIVITISREYGSGGRFVGKLVSGKLGIPFYDKEIIDLASKKSGLDTNYIKKIDQTKTKSYMNNNEDLLYIAEEKVIKNIGKDSCVIVGRCADYILRKNKNLIKIFLYSDLSSKEKKSYSLLWFKRKKYSKTTR